MSTIFFCGDVHGDFQHVIEAVQAHEPDAIILLGDLQARASLEVELSSILMQTEIWFIHGNHDTDSEADHDHLLGSSLANRILSTRMRRLHAIAMARWPQSVIAICSTVQIREPPGSRCG